MSSIADKFKKLLPASNGNDKARVDGSGSTLSIDDVDTVQVPDEKTVRIARNGGAPTDTSFGDLDLPGGGDAANEPAAPVPEAVLDTAGGRAGSGLAKQQRILAIVLAVVVLLLLLVAGSAILRAERLAQQVAATGQSLMQSQRLAKSISQALVGSASAFVEVKDSADDLSRRVAGLTNGDDSLRLERVGNQYDEEMNKINPLVTRADASAKAVLAQRQILTQVGAALRDINQQSSTLLEMTETVASLKMQQNATLPEISAAGQLVMLTQRIGKSTNEFFTVEGVNPDAVFLLGKDLNTFQETTRGLLDGNAQQRFPGSRDPQTREQLEAILKTYEQMRTQASAILGNLQGLVAAREAQASILTDSEPCARRSATCRKSCPHAPAWAPAPSCCCSCCRWLLWHSPAPSVSCRCAKAANVPPSPNASVLPPSRLRAKPAA